MLLPFPLSNSLVPTISSVAPYYLLSCSLSHIHIRYSLLPHLLLPYPVFHLLLPSLSSVAPCLNIPSVTHYYLAHFLVSSVTPYCLLSCSLSNCVIRYFLLLMLLHFPWFHSLLPTLFLPVPLYHLLFNVSAVTPYCLISCSMRHMLLLTALYVSPFPSVIFVTFYYLLCYSLSHYLLPHSLLRPIVSSVTTCYPIRSSLFHCLIRYSLLPHMLLPVPLSHPLLHATPFVAP